MVGSLSLKGSSHQTEVLTGSPLQIVFLSEQPVLTLTLFNILINALDDRMESSLEKFRSNTMLR